MMKIVNIEDFFHPNAGYQINLLSKYLAKFGHDVTIITSKMDKIPEELTMFFGRDNIEKYDKEYEDMAKVKIIRLPIVKFISGRAVFTDRLRKTVDNLKPDILYVHGNDTLSAMYFIARLGKLNYALISDSHMLEMASKNKFNYLFRQFYRVFFTPKLIKYNVPVLRTQNDTYVEKNLGIPLNQAPWISYGSDTMLFYPDRTVREEFRRNNNIRENDFVILYAGKLDESKGGKLLAEVILEKFNSYKDVVIIIVGNAIGEYGRKVEELFAKSQNRVLRFPTQQYRDLASFYKSADLAVFPKQCSLSFYDVQACGLPVIFEDNNVNIDRCRYGNGWTFESGNSQSFRNKIQEIIDMPEKEFQKTSNLAYQFVKKNYDYESKAREYEHILMRVYEQFSDR